MRFILILILSIISAVYIARGGKVLLLLTVISSAALFIHEIEPVNAVVVTLLWPLICWMLRVMILPVEDEVATHD